MRCYPQSPSVLIRCCSLLSDGRAAFDAPPHPQFFRFYGLPEMGKLSALLKKRWTFVFRLRFERFSVVTRRC